MRDRDRRSGRGPLRPSDDVVRSREPFPGAAERGRPLLAISDAELVARISANEAEAYHECMARFGSLLHELARRFGAAPDRAWETVTLVLDDVMDRIRAHRYPRNRPLGGYLVTTLRCRLRDERRNAGVRKRVVRDAAVETDAPGQLVVRSLSSDHAWRALRPPDEADDERSTLPPAVRALHDALVAQLDEDDRRLLDWRGDHVVQRQMAEWRGEAHGTTRNRLSKVRAEMMRATRRYLATLENEHDRAEIERYMTGWLRRPAQACDERTARGEVEDRSDGRRTAAEGAAEEDDA